MITNEFLRFIETLREDERASADERRIANLVHDHLDEIIPLGTAAGRRVRRITELCPADFDQVSADLSRTGAEANVPETDMRSLASITVGPFRGFRTQAYFDVDSNLVLIYGPNGTGKTSLCESLEYALLGSVQEAESKRFGGIDQYLENADAGEFAAPVIRARDESGDLVNVTPDENAFRFCFVEKNRIDSFSRIASFLPAKQINLIASLFGLEDFNEFVRAFSDSINETYLDQTGRYRQELEAKQNEIAADRRTIETEKARLPDLRDQAKRLAESVKDGLRFAQLESVLGTDDEPGLIQALQTKLAQPAEKPSGLKRREELRKLDDLRMAVEKHLEDCAKYDTLRDQLSYLELYRAVSQISNKNKTQCPACETPVNRTAKNPFEAAEQGMKELEDLANLESQIQRNEANHSKSIQHLQKTISVASEYHTDSEVIAAAQVSMEEEAEITWFQNHFIREENESGNAPDSLRKDLETALSNVEKHDEDIGKSAQQRAAWEAELRRLRTIRDEMLRLKFQRTQTAENLRRARASIRAFKRDNQTLLAQVEAERAQIDMNRRIAAAYASFVERLRAYNDGLPAKLVEDLGERATEIYNAFNRGDDESEKMASIRLPTSPDERLEITYRTDPDTYKDALHVLSEGHIRCIGLAILIAKNIESGAPLLIFDDPVNAIDDDHREAIRMTLFDDDVLEGKQILLTCHGEEFFKNVQTSLGAERARTTRCVTFLRRSADRDIRYDAEPDPRNYVVAARRDFERNNVRNSLGHSRRALEYLLKTKLWNHVDRHGDPKLKITLRSPRQPIELRNLFDQLRTNVRNHRFVSPHRADILEQLNVLNGINADGQEWRCLNGGIHEDDDRAEFDRLVVGRVIGAIEALDSILH